MLNDSLSDLHALLRARPALIVHFSGCPRGVGRVINYPHDLAWALVSPTEILCCSTIEPRDFDSFQPGASGFVGVVLDPVDERSIVYVDHEDHGAPATTADRLAMDRPESIATCERSFERDGATPYNEWLVGPFRVVGMFVAPGAEIQEPDRTFSSKSPSDVLSDFGQHRMFSCHAGQFWELLADQNWAPLDMASVYP